MLLDAFADRLHDLEVDAQKIVAAHPRLSRHAGGDDADIGARNVSVGVGALQIGVEPLDRAALRQIQGLPLGNTFGNVKDDDVAKFLDRGEMGKRAADLASADKSDLGSCHGDLLRFESRQGRSPEIGFCPALQCRNGMPLHTMKGLSVPRATV
ncbi:hypothetical protein MASR1M32_37510 [Rhodobacter sp.]